MKVTQLPCTSQPTVARVNWSLILWSPETTSNKNQKGLSTGVVISVLPSSITFSIVWREQEWSMMRTWWNFTRFQRPRLPKGLSTQSHKAVMEECPPPRTSPPSHASPRWVPFGKELPGEVFSVHLWCLTREKNVKGKRCCCVLPVPPWVKQARDTSPSSVLLSPISSPCLPLKTQLAPCHDWEVD